MARLRIKDGRAAVDDRAKGQEITLDAWRDGVRPEAGRFELSIPNTEDVEALAAVVSRFDAVILDFPTFQDGRAYSQARTLRERLAFKGEIRARGDVLCDQALFMIRCGFDALDIGDGDIEGFRRALNAYSAVYQPAGDDMTPIRMRRLPNSVAA
ncbi:MAG TPA: DUF934 domain-containing protein [Parvularculaceae bacterium]|nr:DUF934 domain-containing protein [Parvularculaceae bacterium]HNS85345.1 DUF934 domain-containing protein [Parvularculaceae bacterium]